MYCAARAIAAIAASWAAALGPEDEASRDGGGGAACEWLVQAEPSAKTATRPAAGSPMRARRATCRACRLPRPDRNPQGQANWPR